MNWDGVLIRRWRETPRWPYVVLALLALPFIGPAYEDAGPLYGGIYAGVTLLGFIQAARLMVPEREPSAAALRATRPAPRYCSA